ncbi:MAG: alcohol dehydrogenase catalytic domain-containing protein, partial [Armatimonadaceae bacterium]
MLPDTFRRWHLYGAGLDSLRLDSVPMPEPGPDEILVRHDACGICFSDIKIINLGPRHPRVFGRDMENNPVVMGHEVALTVEKVGANRTDRFRPGQRFIVQADVFYKGNNIAYGYALLGGMAQWGLVGNEVLDGDEGCYLLPLPDHVGVVAAALVEPWACVEAAHRWDESGPLHAVLDGEITDESVAAACVGMPRDGVVRVSADARGAGAVAVDVGRVHYDGWRFVGPKPNTRCELKADGTVWMVGAGGPMGQMHVQRALALPNPPRRIVVTDRH